jgi:membrane-associated phospholipid phosphatase
MIQQTMMLPTQLDLWVAKELAEFVAAHPQLSLAVDSGIRHTVFGGLWFGVALFIFWCHALQAGHREVRIRILTILAGSILAVLLTLAAGSLISWPPPIKYPEFTNFYPTEMRSNLNTNCFPSQSTAVYACIAAGIYSLQKTWGWILWALVAICVAIPRMVVGGHYLSDVLAGSALALISYGAVRYLLEETLISGIEMYFDGRPSLRVLREFVVFIWIFQVTVEFREVVWAKVVMQFFLRKSGG